MKAIREGAVTAPREKYLTSPAPTFGTTRSPGSMAPLSLLLLLHIYIIPTVLLFCYYSRNSNIVVFANYPQQIRDRLDTSNFDEYDEDDQLPEDDDSGWDKDF